jgi:peptidoglycan/LPS O-acetylase OafA/YrhL
LSVLKKKNLEIEYLRAVSICLVLIAHSPLISNVAAENIFPLFKYLSFGVGVDLFFCISGYVVSRSYFAYFDHYRGVNLFWPAARAFWVRRAYRLLPSAWLWVAFGLVACLMFNRSGIFLDIDQNLKSAWSVMTFTANLANARLELAPNNIYWSLSLEEQFYFVFPLLLLIFKSMRGRVLLLILLIVVQFPLMRSAFGDTVPRYLAAFRVDSFAWGILLYMISHTDLYRRFEPGLLGRSKPLALLATLMLIFLMIAIPARFYTWPPSMGVMAMVAACLVWLASYDRGYIFGYSGLSSLLIWLGSRSYAIYLIHWPMLKVVNEISFRLAQVGFVVAPQVLLICQVLGFMVLTALLAELNFRCVEQPLRRRGVAISRRMLGSPAAQTV